MVEALISSLAGALLPGVLWKNRMKSLVATMVGLMLAGKANIWEMGGLMPGPALPVNKGKRASRLYNNLNISLDDIARALLRAVTVNLTDVIVAVDWTEFGSWKILKAAIVAKGRGIPIYWKAVKDGSRRMADVEVELCDKLLQLLPAAKRLLILGDRGFDSADLVLYLKQRGIKFVLRFSHNVCIALRNAAFVRVEDIPLKVGEIVDYGLALYTKGFSVPVRVVRTRMDGQDDDWNLVTNLGKNAAAELIVKLYGCRFTIEELFRDLKGGCWEIVRTRVLTVEAMERLCMVLSLSHILLVVIGRWAKKNGLEGQFRSTEGLSYFRLGERVVRAAAIGNLRTKDPIEFIPQFAELPIAIGEIVHIPWNVKRSRSKPKEKMSGGCLRAYLQAMKLSQPELAKIIGCRQSIVSNVANERMPMPPAWLEKLLRHANMTQEQFLALPVPSTEERPPISGLLLHAYMVSQNLKQSQIAGMVNTKQPNVSAVVNGKKPMPHAWLPVLLDHAGITEEAFFACPRPDTTQDQLCGNKTTQTSPSSTTTEAPCLAGQRRIALQILWRRYKQKELAEVLGVSQPTVSSALAGKRDCPEHWVPLLCAAYELTPEEFLAMGVAHLSNKAA